MEQEELRRRGAGRAAGRTATPHYHPWGELAAMQWKQRQRRGSVQPWRSPAVEPSWLPAARTPGRASAAQQHQCGALNQLPAFAAAAQHHWLFFDAQKWEMTEWLQQLLRDPEEEGGAVPPQWPMVRQKRFDFGRRYELLFCHCESGRRLPPSLVIRRAGKIRKNQLQLGCWIGMGSRWTDDYGHPAASMMTCAEKGGVLGHSR